RELYSCAAPRLISGCGCLSSFRNSNRTLALRVAATRLDTSIFAGELLGTGFAGQRDQLLQVGRIIDVHSNARQLQHDARLARTLGGGEMRFEAVVAETQRKQICWTAKGSVCS